MIRIIKPLSLLNRKIDIHFSGGSLQYIQNQKKFSHREDQTLEKY